jgi:DNA mismatch repair protein MutH
MTHTEYHASELYRLARKLHHLTLASLADRKEAQADAADLMRDTARVSRNIEWALNGSYGYAEQQSMIRIQSMKRGNREAQAMQLLAALDCFCPARECILAWKSLTKEEQDALGFAVRSALDLCEVQS